MVDRKLLEEIKIAALSQGVRIAPAVLEALGGPDRLTVHEYATTGGITLVLCDDVYVNAPFDEPFVGGSPLLLTGSGAGLVLELEASSVPVTRVVPLPGYLRVIDGAGAPVTDTTMSHADRIRVSPIAGCAYDCGFCDVASLRYRPRPVDQVLRGIDVALQDTALPPRHLLISGGSPAKGEAHQQAFEDTCRTIVEHVRSAPSPAGSDFEIDIMMSARPDGPAFVDRMVDAGISGFSINLEVHAETHAMRHMRLKHRFTREHLAPMIARAVERLGRESGRVRSLIIPGLEPVEDTIAGIAWLAELGCSPVISPFRPARHTQLANEPPVTREALRTVLNAAREIVAEHGVPLGPRCVPCQHNTLSFPWDLATDARR